MIEINCWEERREIWGAITDSVFREDLPPDVHLRCDFMFIQSLLIFAQNVLPWPTLFIAYLIFVEMGIRFLSSDFILLQAKYVSKVNETSKVNRNKFHSKNIFITWEVTLKKCSEKNTELGIRTPGVNPQATALWLLAVKQATSLL